jgi:hypothetical protein
VFNPQPSVRAAAASMPRADRVNFLDVIGSLSWLGRPAAGGAAAVPLGGSVERIGRAGPPVSAKRRKRPGRADLACRTGRGCRAVGVCRLCRGGSRSAGGGLGQIVVAAWSVGRTVE